MEKAKQPETKPASIPENRLMAWFILCPLGIGAGFHFFDVWLAWPIAIILFILWIGTLAQIHEYTK